MRRLGAIVALLTLTGACSAEVEVVELKPKASPGTTADGVPFRAKERYELIVYQRTTTGYKEVGRKLESLPNPNKVYVLQHLGQALADTNTKFVLRNDGTLESVHLGASSKADEALTALKAEVTAAGAKIAEIRTARETAEAGEEGLDVAYQKALNAATLAQAKLDGLATDATAETVVQHTNDLRLAQLEANIAARRAGLPRPYPDLTF